MVTMVHYSYACHGMRQELIASMMAVVEQMVASSVSPRKTAGRIMPIWTKPDVYCGQLSRNMGARFHGLICWYLLEMLRWNLWASRPLDLLEGVKTHGRPSISIGALKANGWKVNARIKMENSKNRLLRP